MEVITNWFNKKFLEWQNEIGKPQTQKAFANYLGIRPTTYSGWINNNILPSGRNLEKVAYKLGYEIYDILGLDRPEPQLPVGSLPEDLRNLLQTAINDLESEMTEQGIDDIETSEGKHLAREVLGKYGFNPRKENNHPE